MDKNLLKQETITYPLWDVEEEILGHMISGRNIAGQESMTYGLSSHGRSKTVRWTEGRKTEPMTYGLSSHVEGKRVIDGQKVAKTGTDDLRPVSWKEASDQWTEGRRTGIDDLHLLRPSEEANTRSVDRMSQDRRPMTPTTCRGIGGSKHAIRWTECSRTGIDDLQAIQGIRGSKHASQGTECRRTETDDLRPAEHRRKQTRRSVDRCYPG